MRALCVSSGIDFYDLLRPKIEIYAQKLGMFLKRFDYIERVFDQGQYDIVAVNSLSSYEENKIIVSDICSKKKRPCVCWMHGGFGANVSLEGMDASDLIFADVYCTYGEAIRLLLDTHFPVTTFGEQNWEKIQRHYPKDTMRVLSVGTSLMERNAPAIEKIAHDQKTVTFIMGNFWIHNRYYMGGNTPYTYAQRWENEKKIMDIFIRYQHQYRIWIKAYPADLHGRAMMRDYFKDHGGAQIAVFGAERNIDDLFRETDLALSSWVSTSFFQAMYYEFDQFLFDDSDLTSEAKEAINQGCFFSADIDQYCRMLEAYLKEGRFYQKDKSLFRSRFMDYEDRTRRTEKTRQVLKTIAMKKSEIGLRCVSIT